MEPIGVFSGLASGIDFRELVDQIITLERRPIDRLQARIDDAEVKRSVFDDFRTLLDGLRTTATSLSDGTAFDAVLTSTSGTSSSGNPLFGAVADPGTVPGTHQVEVLSLATAEKLGGGQVADPDTALGISGEFVLNGTTVQINATDTLRSVRDLINIKNTGTNGTGVTASIVSTGGFNRLILTSDTSGAAGIALADTAADVLSQLGFVDGTTSIAQPNSSGADSAKFSSDTTAMASLLALTSPVGPQNVTIGGNLVAIDLDTQSLTAIAATIDALTGVSATVQSETQTDGSLLYYLDIRGTTSFADAGHALELLGVVTQGRGGVAHEVTGAPLHSDAGGTPATTATLLSSLFQNGQATNVQVGDTFDISGTRGDGSTVSFTYTVGAGDTVQSVLNALNDNVTGFGAGARPATATLNASGAIVLTDNTAGDSFLDLSIVSNNEGGGTIDFGTFGITTLGRERELATGTDALLRVDGITMSRETNTVTDAIEGVTLTLTAAEAGRIGTVAIGRSTDEAAGVLQNFVDGYNELVTFVKGQLFFNEGEARPALFGDTTLRTTRNSVVEILLNTINGVATDLNTTASVGIELNRDGTLKFDAAKFQTAFNTRYNDVLALFSESGIATDPEVAYISSAGTAVAGTYAVDITTPASQATVLGAGFTGTYVDDATADTMTLTDVVTGNSASIQLSNGMTTQDIVDALNVEFGLTTNHVLTAANVLFSDTAGTTPVTTSTTFDSLFAGPAAPAGVTAGDTIDYSGIRPDGTAYSGVFVVDDPTTKTIGDLVTAIQSDVGADTSVSVVNGAIVVQDNATGVSSLTASIVANNEGGGTLDFGAMTVTTQGRLPIGLTAQASGNDIDLTHAAFGSSQGFTVAYTAGGGDGTAQLGIAATQYDGIDVAGTVGGFAATGSGQQLVGDPGTPVSGLHVSYTGTTVRAAGDVVLTVGTGAALERLFDGLFEVGTGVLDARNTSYDDQVTRLTTTIERAESRVARRETMLIRRFAAMETVIAQLQAQSESLANQIQSLLSPGG